MLSGELSQLDLRLSENNLEMGSLLAQALLTGIISSLKRLKDSGSATLAANKTIARFRQISQ